MRTLALLSGMFRGGIVAAVGLLAVSMVADRLPLLLGLAVMGAGVAAGGVLAARRYDEAHPPQTAPPERWGR